MNSEEHKESALLTWFVVLLLLGFILGKGFLSFYMVGDLGQPTWDYRPIADLPGESPYAIYPSLPHPQHIRGAKGE
jgi:hypothetical protein